MTKYFKSTISGRVRKVEEGQQVHLFGTHWVVATKAEYDEWERKRAVKREIRSCKNELAKTDYQAIKHSEGWINEEDYAPIKAARQAIRDRINELEETL